MAKFRVYDVPVILKSYYDNVDRKAFELNILQKLLQSARFSDYRMLTDFVNLKFANCYGKMTNMKYNKVTLESVIDIGLSSIPTPRSVGSRYIVSGNEGGSWAGKDGMIAVCTSLSPLTWSFIQPKVDDIVYVEQKKKKYVFGDMGWVVPEFSIPLTISIEIVKSRAMSTSETLFVSTVKKTIVSAFESRFGIQSSLYRSEIIDVCHNIEGVDHVRLIEPRCNIFYNYTLEDLTEEELMEYVPEYLYFTTDTITLTVL